MTEPPAPFDVLLDLAMRPDRATVRYPFQGTIQVSATELVVEGDSRFSRGGGMLLTIGLGVLFGRQGASIGSGASHTPIRFRIDPQQARGHFDDQRRTISIENAAGGRPLRWVLLRSRSAGGYQPLRDALAGVMQDRFRPLAMTRRSWQHYLITVGVAAALFCLSMALYLVISGTGHATLPWETGTPDESTAAPTSGASAKAPRRSESVENWTVPTPAPGQSSIPDPQTVFDLYNVPIGKPLATWPVQAKELPTLTLPTAAQIGRSIAGPARIVDGLRVTPLDLNGQKFVDDVVWSRGGDAFFALTAGGALMRVAFDTGGQFTEDRRLELGHQCESLALSAEGLVVSIRELEEVWVIDPRTLSVRKRIASPKVGRVISAPSLSFALAMQHFEPDNQGEDRMTYLDLAGGHAVVEIPGWRKNARLQPDGTHYFAEGDMEKLISFRIDGTKVSVEGRSERIASNGQSVSVSPDGRFVCLPAGGGNYRRDDGTYVYGTNVYRTDDLSKPAFQIESGPYPRHVAFDFNGKWVYAQGSHLGEGREFPLMIYDTTGTKLKESRLGLTPDYKSWGPRQFAAHPAGEKLIVTFDDAAVFVEIELK